MKVRVILLALVAALSVAGCAGTGNRALSQETEASVSTKIFQGKTTKDEVRQMFGSPMKTSFTDSGLGVWNDEFANLHADAVNFIPIVGMFGSSHSGDKKELVVLFDEQNVVKRYSMSQSKISTKTGLFNQ